MASKAEVASENVLIFHFTDITKGQKHRSKKSVIKKIREFFMKFGIFFVNLGGNIQNIFVRLKQLKSSNG